MIFVEQKKKPGTRRIRGRLSDEVLKAEVLGSAAESSSSDDSDAGSGDGSEWSEEDDPDRLWCICKKPWNQR